MLPQVFVLMAFQLAGEMVSYNLGVPLPGTLCGLLLLLGWLSLRGGPSAELSQAAGFLVDHLGLLFVPAGAAIISFGSLLAADGLAIAAALLISTGLGILVAGLLGAVHVEP